jgi:hypothetical protein
MLLVLATEKNNQIIGSHRNGGWWASLSLSLRSLQSCQRQWFDHGSLSGNGWPCEDKAITKDIPAHALLRMAFGECGAKIAIIKSQIKSKI